MQELRATQENPVLFHHEGGPLYAGDTEYHPEGWYVADGEDYLPVWSVAPRAEAPTSVKGGFRRSATVWSVARKGRMTQVGHSADCTYQGDRPSKVVEVPDGCPRVLVMYTTYGGNGGDCGVRLYQ